MLLETASKEQKSDIERRIALGYGEIVTVKFNALEPLGKDEAPAEDDVVVTFQGKQYKRVEKKREFYVGRMDAGTTGGVLATLGVLAVNGMKYKDMFDLRHNLAFLEVLDRYHLTLLISLALGDKDQRDWVDENFDIDWVSDVLVAFFKYNDFFGLVGKLTSMLQKFGVSEEQAKRMLAGS